MLDNCLGSVTDVFAQGAMSLFFDTLYAPSAAHLPGFGRHDDGATIRLQEPLLYRRRSFLRKVRYFDAEQTSMYSTCWVLATHACGTPYDSWALISASGMTVASGAPFTSSSWGAVAVLLTGDDSVAPSLRGMHLSSHSSSNLRV